MAGDVLESRDDAPESLMTWDKAGWLRLAQATWIWTLRAYDGHVDVRRPADLGSARTRAERASPGHGENENPMTVPGVPVAGLLMA
jgi:hypothetical protein